MGHLPLEWEKFNFEPSVAILLDLLLLAIGFHIESEDSALERRLVQGVAKVRQIFIELLHAFQVGLLHFFRSVPEEVWMRILEELLQPRLARCSGLERGVDGCKGSLHAGGSI